jgi:peptide/nickel transport system substrate-binding protein
MQVRRAIMKAMDVSLMIDEYYAGGLASQIYRPMSITSWAYPGKVTEHQNVKYETDDAEIRRLVEDAGYVYDSSDGYYKKDGKKITLKFTIAGGTTDHPATVMFEAARRRLNAIGFDITVGTDVNALKNLATGNLAVWAAAWSSPLDPDMYQVYHKNSTATSVLNWNYKEILFTDKFPDEKRIVNELSVLIDDARETTVQAERADCYAKALDKVMELAIELPTYQRKELAVYNKNLIDANSLNENPTWMAGVVNEIWKLNFN